MPPQDTYTRDPLIRAYGAFLRALRDARELTRQDLADALGCGKEWIEKLETAQRPTSEQTAIDLDTYFFSTSPEEKGPFWKSWNEIRKQGKHLALLPGFSGYVDQEATAASLYTFETNVIPGLFQTEAYATEVLKGGRTAEQLKQLVAARMDRKKTLARKEPPHVVAVIDRTALHRRIGNADVMREQVRHLIALAEEHPTISIQIVPDRSGAYAGLPGAFTIVGAGDGKNLVYVEGHTTGQLIDHVQEVLEYTRRFDLIRGAAASADESLSMLNEILETM